MRPLLRFALSRLALTGLLVWPATRLAAQGLLPSGTGFSLAASGSLSRASASGSGLEGSATRPVGSVELAYGATPRLALLVAGRPMRAAAGAQDYTVNGVELGLRYLAQAGRRLRPFVEAGFGVRTLRYVRGDVFTAPNVGPFASVGAMRLTTGHWSAEAAATWTATRFENWRRNGEAIVAEAVEWNAVGARIGVRYWVRAR